MKIILGSSLKDSLNKLRPNLNGSDMRALCIPTAANCYTQENRTWQYEEITALESIGLSFEMCDLEKLTTHEVKEKINNFNTIYITGGNTYYLLERMQNSGFLHEFKNWQKLGKTYLGSSAGAVIACPDIRYIGTMDEPEKAELTDYSGLGICQSSLVVHADHEKYGSIAQSILSIGSPYAQNLIALNDDQIWIKKENEKATIL